jgi:creatinine amidohydrolase
MAPDSLPFPTLSQVPSPLNWAHQSYLQFPPAPSVDKSTLCVLPIYNFADHGLGLPLDTEEVLGSAVLNRAFSTTGPLPPLRVLPPLRFGLAPYGPNIGRISPEYALAQLREISLSIQRSGYQKLLFLVTSPWNKEIVDVAARDARIELGLQTFLIGLQGVGLGLYPAKGNRADAQVVASFLLNQTPCDSAGPNSSILSDDTKRPGNWSNLPPVKFDSAVNGEELLSQAGERLVALLQDISAHPNLDRSSPEGTSLPSDDHFRTESITYPFDRRERYLPSLTATELTALSDHEKDKVIIPIGAIEQHGPHLPVGVDAFLGEAAAQALSRRLAPNKSIWFGPSITYAKSNEHLTFRGSVSISAQTLGYLITSLAEQFKELGFAEVVILNTHGGNSPVIDYTLREIQSSFGIRVEHLRIPSPDSLSAQEKAWGFHAGEWETSLMLALTPNLVDQGKAICHYPAKLTDPGNLRPDSAPATYAWQTDDIAPAGVMGDATAASAAKGYRWFNEAMDKLHSSLTGSA